MASDSASNDKVTFGAVVDAPTPQSTAVVTDTTLCTPATPSTPFYSIASAQPSLQSLPSKKEPNVAVYETDLEAGRPCDATPTPLGSQSALDLPYALPVATNDSYYKRSFEGRTKECTIWPTKETLRDKAKAQKVKKQQKTWHGCLKTKWDDMSKKQRIWVRVLVLLVIVALAFGLGIGISRAVHAGIYAGKGETKPIDN